MRPEATTGIDIIIIIHVALDLLWFFPARCILNASSSPDWPAGDIYIHAACTPAAPQGRAADSSGARSAADARPNEMSAEALTVASDGRVVHGAQAQGSRRALGTHILRYINCDRRGRESSSARGTIRATDAHPGIQFYFAPESSVTERRCPSSCGSWASS